MEVSGDEEAVARSLSDGSYFILKDGILKFIPRVFIVSKLYPTGISEPPLITEWAEANVDKIEDFDFSMSEMSLQ